MLLIETRTSVYRLEKADDINFKLTKVAIKLGCTSMAPAGTVFFGPEIRITRNGLYLGDSKTSPIVL